MLVYLLMVDKTFSNWPSIHILSKLYLQKTIPRNTNAKINTLKLELYFNIKQDDVNKINISQLFKCTLYLRAYTSNTRMSGTPGGDELVQMLYNSWNQSGIDNVRLTPYDVLMSYPNETNPNKVKHSLITFYILCKTGSI